MNNHSHIVAPTTVNIKTDTSTFSFARKFLVTICSEELESLPAQCTAWYLSTNQVSVKLFMWLQYHFFFSLDISNCHDIALGHAHLHKYVHTHTHRHTQTCRLSFVLISSICVHHLLLPCDHLKIALGDRVLVSVRFKM